MARFLHRVAASFVEEVLGTAYHLCPLFGLFLASATPSAAGHLGLARVSESPALHDVLTPGAFLLDATRALGGCPHTTERLRCFRDSTFPEELVRAEAEDDAKKSEVVFVFRALLDTEDGRNQDALDNLARLAAECPDCYVARLYAAGIYDPLRTCTGVRNCASDLLRAQAFSSSLPSLAACFLPVPSFSNHCSSNLAPTPRIYTYDCDVEVE